jgi:hypothetical protein
MPVVYKACTSSYVVFTVMPLVPFSIGVAALVKTGDPSVWKALAICVGAWVFAVAWLSRYRLEFTEVSVVYSSMFSRARRVVRSEIVSARFASKTSRFEGPATFVINTASGQELRINAKVFSVAAVRALFDLAPKNRGEANVTSDVWATKRWQAGSLLHKDLLDTPDG